MHDETAIKVENLSKVFSLRQPRIDEDGIATSEHWALKDVSFEIKKGESVGIIGPNGSGKSTLLKILAGVTKPTSGTVKIRGKVASILDIGAGFHPELSGRENVFLNGQIHGFSKKEIEAKFNEIVQFSGIEKFIDEPVKNYSNGMYLRLAFSIMAHLDFDVYLLDEVLSVGDAEFMIASGNWVTKSEKTFVVVSHNIKELMQITSKIATVKNGSVRFIDSSEVFDLKINANILHEVEQIKNKTFNYFEFNLLSLTGEHQSCFDYKDEIRIHIQLKNIDRNYVIGCIIRTFNNNFVCESAFQGCTNALFTTKFPSHFFNNMKYKVDLAFAHDNKIAHYIEDVGCFEVVNAPTPLGVNTWGVVMPKLIWDQN